MTTFTPDKIDVIRFSCGRDEAGDYHGVTVSFVENGRNSVEAYEIVDVKDEWDAMLSLQKTDLQMREKELYYIPAHICLMGAEKTLRIFEQTHIEMATKMLDAVNAPQGGVCLRKCVLSFGEEG